MSSIRELILRASDQLSLATEVPRLEAEVLLGFVLRCERLELITRMHEAAPESVSEEFFSLVRRRAGREPLSYIIGQKEFFGLPFSVTPETLIPRPETELLVEKGVAIALSMEHSLRVIDVGTGSGCIAIAFVHEVRKRGGRDPWVLAADRSRGALKVASQNARTLGCGSQVRFVASDWLSSLVGGFFDLFLSNPPYIAEHEQLMPELSHEPGTALFAGRDGLDAYRLLVPELHRILSPNGRALFEIGAGQAEGFAAIARFSRELELIAVHKDLSGRDRVVELRKSS